MGNVLGKWEGAACYWLMAAADVANWDDGVRNSLKEAVADELSNSPTPELGYCWLIERIYFIFPMHFKDYDFYMPLAARVVMASALQISEYAGSLFSTYGNYPTNPIQVRDYYATLEGKPSMLWAERAAEMVELQRCITEARI